MSQSFKDRADWTDVKLKSVNVGATSKLGFPFEGYDYVTVGELMVAKLLHKMRIPFTPDVSTEISIPEELRVGREKKTRRYVPDFIFNKQAYVWAGRDGPKLIHGIECKRALSGRFPLKAVKYVKLLEEQHGIVIHLMNDREIRECFEKGRLPLYRYKQKRDKKP